MTYECNHRLVPIVYGYMNHEIMGQIESGDIVYGEYNRPPDASDWFCLNCLEDVTL
jgi:hypothetical protein